MASALQFIEKSTFQFQFFHIFHVLYMETLNKIFIFFIVHIECTESGLYFGSMISKIFVFYSRHSLD